jgi:hypothetical protein
MEIGESNERLRKVLNQIIEDGIITHAEYDRIMKIITQIRGPHLWLAHVIANNKTNFC